MVITRFMIKLIDSDGLESVKWNVSLVTSSSLIVLNFKVCNGQPLTACSICLKLIVMSNWSSLWKVEEGGHCVYFGELTLSRLAFDKTSDELSVTVRMDEGREKKGKKMERNELKCLLFEISSVASTRPRGGHALNDWLGVLSNRLGPQKWPFLGPFPGFVEVFNFLYLLASSASSG